SRPLRDAVSAVGTGAADDAVRGTDNCEPTIRLGVRGASRGVLRTPFRHPLRKTARRLSEPMIDAIGEAHHRRGCAFVALVGGAPRRPTVRPEETGMKGGQPGSSNPVRPAVETIGAASSA